MVIKRALMPHVLVPPAKNLKMKSYSPCDKLSIYETNNIKLIESKS